MAWSRASLPQQAARDGLGGGLPQVEEEAGGVSVRFRQPFGIQLTQAGQSGTAFAASGQGCHVGIGQAHHLAQQRRTGNGTLGMGHGLQGRQDEPHTGAVPETLLGHHVGLDALGLEALEEARQAGALLEQKRPGAAAGLRGSAEGFGPAGLPREARDPIRQGRKVT